MTFGQRIQQARKAQGLSLTGIAEAVGLCVSYVYKLENDDCAFPSYSIISRFSEVLNVSKRELLNCDGDGSERVRCAILARGMTEEGIKITPKLAKFMALMTQELPEDECDLDM